MQPYRAIPGSPLLICYQMSDQHVGKWKDSHRQMLKPATMLKFTSFRKENEKHTPAYLKITRQKERMLHSMHREISCLLIHHLAAELKQDVISLTFAAMNQLLVVISDASFHRLYFTLKKKAPAMSVTVSPCDVPIEWSLAARTLKDKPLKSLQCE